jgi:hypothetical protein
VSATLPQHRRLMRLGDLSERHHGRTVQTAAVTGTLTGILSVGNRVQLALVVGGARAWTDWLDVETAVEVWKP